MTRFLIIGNETELHGNIQKKILYAGGNSVKILPPQEHSKLVKFYQTACVTW